MRRSEHSSGRSLGFGIDDFSPGDALGMYLGIKNGDNGFPALNLAAKPHHGNRATVSVKSE